MQTSGTNLVQHPLPTPELRGRRNLLGAAALTAALTLACSASWAQTATATPSKGGAANLAMVGEPLGLVEPGLSIKGGGSWLDPL